MTITVRVAFEHGDWIPDTWVVPKARAYLAVIVVDVENHAITEVISTTVLPLPFVALTRLRRNNVYTDASPLVRSMVLRHFEADETRLRMSMEGLNDKEKRDLQRLVNLYNNGAGRVWDDASDIEVESQYVM